jgi:hypothetical protein
MRSSILLAPIIGLIVWSGTVQAAPEQQVVDLLSKNANEACLVGNEWHFYAKVTGEISIRKQGGSGDIDIKDITAPGAAGFLDEKIKAAFGDKIMQCLQPYHLKIQDYILASATGPKEKQVIQGNSATSHAGDDPADGFDAVSCVTADVQHGWSLMPNSGTTITDSIANGSIGVTSNTYNGETFCTTFHMVRADRGHSAGVQAHAQAIQTRPARSQ